MGNVMTVASAQDWHHLLKSHSAVMAKFSASWCNPCKTIQPVYESLAAKHHATRFVVIDADQVHEIADEYKVALLPTFILFRSGGEIERYSGSDPNKLQNLIEKMTADAK